MLQGNGVKAVPIMTHPGIELIGSTVRKAVTDGNVHSDAICALNERFPLAAAITAISAFYESLDKYNAR